MKSLPNPLTVKESARIYMPSFHQSMVAVARKTAINFNIQQNRERKEKLQFLAFV